MRVKEKIIHVKEVHTGLKKLGINLVLILIVNQLCLDIGLENFVMEILKS